MGNNSNQREMKEAGGSKRKLANNQKSKPNELRERGRANTDICQSLAIKIAMYQLKCMSRTDSLTRSSNLSTFISESLKMEHCNLRSFTTMLWYKHIWLSILAKCYDKKPQINKQTRKIAWVHKIVWYRVVYLAECEMLSLVSSAKVTSECVLSALNGWRKSPVAQHHVFCMDPIQRSV